MCTGPTPAELCSLSAVKTQKWPHRCKQLAQLPKRPPNSGKIPTNWMLVLITHLIENRFSQLSVSYR